MGSVCIHLVFSVWDISLTMKEFCSLLCLLLVLPGSLSECDFKDESLFDGTFDINQPTTGGNDYGALVHGKMYIWPNHRVNYIFDPSMSRGDKRKIYNLLKPIFNSYRKKTCVRFNYNRNPPKQYLLINAKFDRNGCSWDGYVTKGNNIYNDEEMLLNFSLPNEIESWCRKYVDGHIYHEMGHAMGIMHTHKRDDRDQYVIYDENCVDPLKTDQFEMIKKHNLKEQLAYECNSIMHYRRNTFNRHECKETDWWCPCNVLTPRPGTNCTAIQPALVPTKLDWDLINIGQSCPK